MAGPHADRTDEQTEQAEEQYDDIEQSQESAESHDDIEPEKSVAERQAEDPLPRLEPMGPGDKEAKRWNTEADAIEEWARTVPGGPEADLARFRREMGWESGSEEPQEQAEGLGKSEYDDIEER